MRLFQAALDTCLDSPFFASLSVHGLHFTVYAPSRFSLQNPKGYQNGRFHDRKFFKVFKLGALRWYRFILVPVWVTLEQHPKGYQNGWVSKWQVFFFSFEELRFWCPFVLVPVPKGPEDWGNQSRSKFSMSLENFNLA